MQPHNWRKLLIQQEPEHMVQSYTLVHCFKYKIHFEQYWPPTLSDCWGGLMLHCTSLATDLELLLFPWKLWGTSPVGAGIKGLGSDNVRGELLCDSACELPLEPVPISANHCSCSSCATEKDNEQSSVTSALGTVTPELELYMYVHSQHEI